jgi:hypothetical protein
MKLSADGRGISPAKRYLIMKSFMEALQRQGSLNEMYQINMAAMELQRQIEEHTASDGACNLQELKLLLERKMVELRKIGSAMEDVAYAKQAEGRVEEAHWDQDCQMKVDAMEALIAQGGCDELAAVLAAAPQWRGSSSSQCAPGVTAQDPSECTTTALGEK